MIYTSSYDSCPQDHYLKYSISGDRGISVQYTGFCVPKLAPKRTFWQQWHDNIGVISEIDNNKYYIKEYFEQVLSLLNPEEIYKELDGSTLLCYENNDEFCHRHIVAAWLELLLGVSIPEVKESSSIKIAERPDYIKSCLEDIMKQHCDMGNFKTLRAAFLYKKILKLKIVAREIREIDIICYDNYLREISNIWAEIVVEENEKNEKLILAKKKQEN